MHHAIEVRDLCKSYGSVPVLQNASFDLRTGERLGLLGPNGAGKTTLIRCLTGRTLADSGSIRLHGQLLRRRGGREALGLVPQELAIYADLTTRENLVAFARFHGLRGRTLRDATDWALHWTGLAERADDLVRSFSGGMQRRVNLACGVMHRPSVILLDEPTVGVDPQSRERIFSMLDELTAQGASVVLTTHHLDEAESRCDRIMIFDHGRVIATGTTTDLIASTLGSSRQIQIRLDRPLTTALPGWHVSDQKTGLTAAVDDLSQQLPGLLNSIHAAGFHVVDMQVRQPSLSEVFLRLTGSELRDQ